jgi:hypothetical protein
MSVVVALIIFVLIFAVRRCSLIVFMLCFLVLGSVFFMIFFIQVRILCVPEIMLILLTVWLLLVALVVLPPVITFVSVVCRGFRCMAVERSV